jgi:hypothetical protein
MSARTQLLRHIADLAEEDVRALLGVVERLRAKHSVPVPEPAPSPLDDAVRHPEQFGGLSGSVRSSGDLESPVADSETWTFDAENVGS